MICMWILYIYGLFAIIESMISATDFCHLQEQMSTFIFGKYWVTCNKLSWDFPLASDIWVLAWWIKTCSQFFWSRFTIKKTKGIESPISSLLSLYVIQSPLFFLFPRDACSLFFWYFAVVSFPLPYLSLCSSLSFPLHSSPPPPPPCNLFAGRLSLWFTVSLLGRIMINGLYGFSWAHPTPRTHAGSSPFQVWKTRGEAGAEFLLHRVQGGVSVGQWDLWSKPYITSWAFLASVKHGLGGGSFSCASLLPDMLGLPCVCIHTCRNLSKYFTVCFQAHQPVYFNLLYPDMGSVCCL